MIGATQVQSHSTRLPGQPTDELSSRQVTFFQVRDWLAENLPEAIDTKAVVVLDVLLAHTLYRGDDYGQVTRRHCSREFLMRRTRLSRDSLTRALVGLEGQNLITRDRRDRRRHQHDVIWTKPLLDLVARYAPIPHTADLSNSAESGVPARARSFVGVKELVAEETSSSDRDDEGSVSGESEKRSSAQVGGGTAQEDHPSPGNLEDGRASSAAPPDGAAPAAAPGSASRDSRGELDAFDEMASDIARSWGPQFKTHLLVPRFRQVARDLDVSADMVDQVLGWWINGYACAAGFKDMDLDDMPNPGGYVYRVLPDLIAAYLSARDEKAAELGVDPATFILIRWLKDHQDQDVPA